MPAPLTELLDNNFAWANGLKREDPAYFRKLVGLQTPSYFWIGCADSRVSANVITGLPPGAVFVHRNVANLVNPGDLNCLSVMQYAVDTLKVRHIIVCGHHGCGGVTAALDDSRHGLVDYWIHPVRDLASAHADELRRISDHAARVNHLCELNVREQVRQVADSPIVRDAWARGQPVTIHGWVYSLEDGLIRDLECGREG